MRIPFLKSSAVTVITASVVSGLFLHGCGSDKDNGNNSTDKTPPSVNIAYP